MRSVLSIEGMSCAHCVQHVTEALEAVKGVKSVKVSLEEKSAIIEHENSTAAADLKNAVTGAGYEAAEI